MSTLLDNTVSVSKEVSLELYRQMLLIRLFESRAGELCRKGEMPSFLHLYVGEEATAVGVCSLLRREDVITSTHRGHGHALAKGVEPNLLMAELYGRANGLCGGRGGSMHLYAPQVGLLGTNGFVGGGLPSAVGVALAAKLQKTDALGVAFFGDGGVNDAAFHESLNLAAAWNLPVLFVCENNLYATATPLESVTRNTDIASRAAAYAMPGETVDGQDVFAVREAASRAIDRARGGNGPTLLECKTYRYVGHHEGDPVTGTYRTAEEVEAWKRRDPIVLMETYLTQSAGVAPSEIDAIRQEITDIVEESVEFARAGAWPDRTSVTDHVFCEER